MSELSEKIAREILSQAECVNSAVVDESDMPQIAAIIDRHLPQWRPIEEAPKDGTQVLGWHRSWSNPLVVHWFTGLHRWSTTMQPAHYLPFDALPPIPEGEQPCPHPIPEHGPAQCKDGHWLGSPYHPVGKESSHDR